MHSPRARGGIRNSKVMARAAPYRWLLSRSGTRAVLIKLIIISSAYNKVCICTMESGMKETTRKQERNRRRRRNNRNKRKERLHQTYAVLQELEEKKEELIQTRGQLAAARKRALKLTVREGACKLPMKCVPAQHNSGPSSVSSLRCFLRSKPTASSRLTVAGVTRYSDSDTQVQNHQAINRIDRYSLVSLGADADLGSDHLESVRKCCLVLLK